MRLYIPSSLSSHSSEPRFNAIIAPETATTSIRTPQFWEEEDCGLRKHQSERRQDSKEIPELTDEQLEKKIATAAQTGEHQVCGPTFPNATERNTRMRTIAIEEHFSLPQEHQRLKEMMNAPDCSPTTSVTVGAALAVFGKMIDLGEGRLADMDAAGIDMQIIQITAAYFDQLDKQSVTSLCRESNDILSQAVRSHPDRFAGFAQLPMKDPEAAVKELERCVSKLGFKAAVWSGMANGHFLDHPSFFPVLAEAERLDVPLYIHPAPPSKEVFDKCYSGLGEASGIFALAGWGMHMESGTHSFRLILSGLFDRLPKLQIITGHMGEAVPYCLERADEFMSYGPYCKLKLERRIGEYYRNNFYFSTSGYYSEPPLLCAVSVVGSDRIILGTDYPYGDSARTTRQINAALLSQDDIANISYRNAEKLFKLKPVKSKNETSVPVLTSA